MTVDRALTAEERRLSQTAMRDQSFLSSLAMNCGSEIGKKIYNTMVFGIEGKHYNFVDKENDRIETVEYASSQGGVDTSYA
ncbi:MAG: hypothetical protein J6Q65_04010, partial [Lentisphaeria bacterium]|nr:hypothetical protein [Lentisphaeria bacterium]